MSEKTPIKVTAYPPARRFPSMVAAVRHAMSHPWSAKSKAHATLLQGHHFIDACWTEFEWHLRFSGDLGLRVWIEDRQINWDLESMVALPADSGHLTIGAAPVSLDWWTTIGPGVMDASSWVRDRRGALFTNLFYSEHGLFLYLSGCKILHLGQAIREPDGRHIIYVREDD